MVGGSNCGVWCYRELYPSCNIKKWESGAKCTIAKEANRDDVFVFLIMSKPSSGNAFKVMLLKMFLWLH